MRLLGGFSQGDVPLSEQFFLGGFDLLRGYDLFSIRGERAALGVVETRLPLGEGLQGVIFSEVGGAWQQANRFSFNNFRASAGVGIRFLSPIGPIRLDAAYGSRLFTYISLGQSF
jgi:outer membrane protein insertion porin family